jgi:hypothetical protein
MPGYFLLDLVLWNQNAIEVNLAFVPISLALLIFVMDVLPHVVA